MSDDYDVYGDTDPNNIPDDGGDQDTAAPAPGPMWAGDGMAGVPVEGYPGLRAGAFGSGRGVLGLARDAALAGRPADDGPALVQFGMDQPSRAGSDIRLTKVSGPAASRTEAILPPPGVSSQALVDQTRAERDHYNRLGDQADLTPGVDAPVGSALRGIPFLDWIWKVRPGGEWDFKELDKSGQRENKYEGFGNYSYMRTGHEGLGIDEETLRRAAGLMQEITGLRTGIDHLLHGRPWNPSGYKSDFGHFWQGPPYGDEPADQAAMPSYPSVRPKKNR